MRFYQHEGVDLPGIARALVNNLRGGDLEGASTITQQLVRNTVLTQEANEISFERKVREAELAIDLEKRYSKDEILLMYLNTINYGDGCYGIEAAARNYFQVSAADLTLAQAAALVGIPQSPNYLNPKEYPDACLARRNVVLDRIAGGRRHHAGGARRGGGRGAGGSIPRPRRAGRRHLRLLPLHELRARSAAQGEQSLRMLLR